MSLFLPYFANTLEYILTTTNANLGNMVSMEPHHCFFHFCR